MLIRRARAYSPSTRSSCYLRPSSTPEVVSMKRLALISAIAAVYVLGAGPGCGGAQGGSGFGQDCGTPSSKDATVDTTQPLTDGKVPILKYDGGGEGGGCGDHCSADLHSVLDCHNNVLLTCPPSEGCGPGGMC